MTKGSEIHNSNKGKTKVFIEICVIGMLFVFVFTFKGTAQTCCSGGVPLGGSLGLGAAESKSLQVLLTYDYNAINYLVSFSELLDDDTRSRTTQSSIVEINYGLNNRFSIAAVVPFIKQTRTIQAYAGEDFTATQGLGDIVFLVKYRLINPENISEIDWIIGAGPKIPTAKTDFTNNQGLTLPADMQPGSGSLDGIFWSSFLKSRFLKNPNLGLAAVTSFRYSGANNHYNETQTYKFGNEFQFSLGLNYNFFAKWPVYIYSFLRYRMQAEDIINGGVFPSSGGEWVYAIPGMNIDFSPNWSFRLSGDIPIYRKLEGTQLTTSYKTTAAVLFNIPFNRNNLIIN
jgi:Putative MetA-pathway of phenol degradation